MIVVVNIDPDEVVMHQKRDIYSAHMYRPFLVFVNLYDVEIYSNIDNEWISIEIDDIYEDGDRVFCQLRPVWERFKRIVLDYELTMDRMLFCQLSGRKMYLFELFEKYVYLFNDVATVYFSFKSLAL